MVKSAIKVFCHDSFLVGGKILYVDQMFSDNTKIGKDLSKDGLVLKHNSNNERVTYGRIKIFKSAGLRGLYGDPDNRNIVENNSENLSKKFKSKLLWYCWKQFSGDYVSYIEYSRSLDSKVSMIKEFRKGFSNK